MSWREARSAYPDRWILIEAIAAHTAEDRRIVDNIRVLGQFTDSASGWHEYGRLHGAEPFRELYVLHTSREEPDIRERRELAEHFSGKLK